MIIDGKKMLELEFKLKTKEPKKMPLKVSSKSKGQSWNQNIHFKTKWEKLNNISLSYPHIPQFIGLCFCIVDIKTLVFNRCPNR
jgi:hypothetical protein